MNPSIELLPASPRQAGTIARLSRDLIEGGQAWRWTPRRVLACIEDAEHMVLTACQASPLTGFAIAAFLERHVHLYLLAVLPTQRRRGLGRRMMHWIETSALAAGTPPMELELLHRDAGSQTFFRRLGYREHTHLPTGATGTADALRMARRVAPAA